MNQKEKRNIEINWAFVLFATILSFLINIISSSVFDMYVNGFRPRVVALLVGFLLITILVIEFLSYIFKNTEKFRDDNLKKIILIFIKQYFKSSTNHKLIFAEKDHHNFDEVKIGTKSIETRAGAPKYQGVVVGDTLTFICGEDKLTKTVTKVFRWKDVDEMVKEIPFKKVMPSIGSIEDMKRVYSSYPNYDEKIKKFGIIGFEL